MTNDSDITIDDLVVTKENVTHIARHDVAIDEVQQALEDGYVTLPAKHGRYMVIGATKAGRCLSIVVAPMETPNHYQLTTARTATRPERRAYITYKLGGKA